MPSGVVDQAPEDFLGPPWSDRRSGEEVARAGDWRAWYDRDRARIIHSSAFRRLQTKTQVLGMGGSDFHRTRLTHSLETAQIAQGIVGRLSADPQLDDGLRRILPPPVLIEAVALAHDFGHPPFGHGGEVALNWCMRGHGGFEGNGQTLRLVARLEAHSGSFGLDLCRRTMLGLLKYPAPFSILACGPPAGDGGRMRAADWKPPKCFLDADIPVVAWMLACLDPADREIFSRFDSRSGRTLNRTLDTSILELADDIAYGVHDLEDAIALGLLRREQIFAVWQQAAGQLQGLRGAPAERDLDALFDDESARKQTIGKLVNFFIVHIGVAASAAMASPLLAWQAILPQGVSDFLQDLKTLIQQRVIRRPDVQMLEYRGQQIVTRLFQIIAGEPDRFLPAPWRERRTEEPDDASGFRSICDYIATMTDEQATRNYELFVGPRGGLAFNVL